MSSAPQATPQVALYTRTAGAKLTGIRSPRPRRDHRAWRLAKMLKRAKDILAMDPRRRLDSIHIAGGGVRYQWLKPDGSRGGLLVSCLPEEIVPVGIELENHLNTLRAEARVKGAAA